MLRRLTALLAVVCLLAAACACARDSRLPAGVERALARRAVPNEHVSIYVRDASTNEVVLDLDSSVARSPASIMKVLTTFAALDTLGPGYTWKTRALIDGELVNGVLNGDLILVGGGDPYMTSERWWDFVQRLRERGLVKITGDVVIDNTYFSPAVESRAAFDGQEFRSYNVLPDALMVNFQTTRLTIAAIRGRTQPQITLHPWPANLTISNQLRLGAGKCAGYNRGISFTAPDEGDTNTLVVSGVFPAACGSYSIDRAVMRAPNYAYGAFRTLWTQAGGAIDGTFRVSAAPATATLLYEHESLPLPQIIRLVNKFSNNVMARHLLLTLGAEQFGPPANVENGRNALRAWLKRRGVDAAAFVLDNGSGLSRAERITARGLGEVLAIAWRSPFMPEFAASLPLSGTDGTLRNRFKATGMQGRIRLKTGRIDDVSALAGYVNAASGRTYILVIVINHPGAHMGAGEAIQSELIRWVFGQ
ncbi:MAG TPA: D-alanyl-D-alanine carboxypeptidase/D-alanyl-D-alanine-endopeptidase [Steroidobacter sp.]|jgi:D-alanyl-D-alanine carboxypeptidase/D-alanyl-D-alanine-endopeptidase (penicillin-binding protein 4)|nr:D-alanyl-D-alanine carboxypeptidase/D-alanyl-D-alanine-endopeptidase [Steroidobacter sp.]